MATELLYDLNLWLIFIASLILLLLATESGFRLGRRVRRGFGEDAKSELGTHQGAILGLLALLLGFTFSMAITRFEARKRTHPGEQPAAGGAQRQHDRALAQSDVQEALEKIW